MDCVKRVHWFVFNLTHLELCRNTKINHLNVFPSAKIVKLFYKLFKYIIFEKHEH